MKLRYLLPALAISATPLLPLHSETPPPAQAPVGTEGSKPDKPPGKHRDPAEMAQKRVDKMTEALGLTPEQSEKITEIFKEQGPAMKALHEDKSLSKEQKHEKMKEMRDGMESKISAVLTPEQNEKWQEHREEMKAKREQGGGNKSKSDN